MIDINSLNLREPDPIDYDNYDSGERKAVVLPPKGVYTISVAAKPEAAATKDNYLMINFPSLMIQAPGTAYDLAEIRFTKKSVKKYANREGTPLGDFLLAFGLKGQRTNEDYVNAALATENRSFTSSVDWRGYCSGCSTEHAKKMEDFPIGADGQRQQWMDCPSGCVDQTDPNAPRPKRVWANLTLGWPKALK